MSRRRVLAGGAWVSLAVGLSPALAACGGGKAPPSGYPLARPDAPVTLPISDSNPAVADGLEPEVGGTFKVLNYADYMAPGVVKDFRESYDVDVQVTPFSNYDELVSKLAAPGVSFDLVFPSPTMLSKLAFSELIQPFNKSYLANVSNVWPEFQDPWYDRGGQYTVPYTVAFTGVGYRADRVSNPSEGYQMLWNPDYAGKVFLLDDAYEALGMSMLANDITADINTSDSSYIDAAARSLIELTDLVQVKTSVSAYERVPSGAATVHQAWSGDLIAGQYYLAEDETPEVLGYWIPDDVSERVVGSDCICIPKSSTKPVLAHHIINELLDHETSLRNFGWVGFQPPLTKFDGQFLVDQQLIPENLMNTVVTPTDFSEGLTYFELEPAVASRWLSAWQEFQSGG